MMTDLAKRREQTILADRPVRQEVLLCKHRQRLRRTDVLSSGNVRLWEIHPKDGASIGNPEARPLCETHIPPVLSIIVRHGAFSAPPEPTSYFPKRHKGLAMLFSYQEAIGE